MPSITVLESFAERIGGHLQHYGADVEIYSFRCGRKQANLYGASYVEIKANRVDCSGKELSKTYRLVADEYWDSDKWLTKVFHGKYSLRDVKRYICNSMNLSIPTRYKGEPVRIGNWT